MKISAWTTYGVVGYSYDVGNDQRSAGGVHCLQVRRTKSGWQTRVRQSNGRYVSYGPVSPTGDEEGAALFETAQQQG